MTKTGYAFGMGTTPSDPDYINTKALERFMRAFDYALKGKYGIGDKPHAVDEAVARKFDG